VARTIPTGRISIVGISAPTGKRRRFSLPLAARTGIRTGWTEMEITARVKAFPNEGESHDSLTWLGRGCVSVCVAC